VVQLCRLLLLLLLQELRLHLLLLLLLHGSAVIRGYVAACIQHVHLLLHDQRLLLQQLLLLQGHGLQPALASRAGGGLPHAATCCGCCCQTSAEAEVEVHAGGIGPADCNCMRCCCGCVRCCCFCLLLSLSDEEGHVTLVCCCLFHTEVQYGFFTVQEECCSVISPGCYQRVFEASDVALLWDDRQMTAGGCRRR
jgi:hypothetical protein